MANSYVNYTGDGATTNFTVTFGYIAQSHVKVYLDGVLQTLTTDYIWLSSTVIQFNTAPAASEAIQFRRETSPTTRLVDYTQPGSLTEEDLDTDSLQAFYLAQEANDIANDSMDLDETATFWDGESKRIGNLAAPVNANDAVRKTDLDTATIAAGNVPTPGNPTDDGKVLKASGGTFSWQANAASNISVTPAGGIAATDVQAAIVELDTEKADATATSAALATKQATSEKGQPNGYASLDSGGLVPSAQLPSGVPTGVVMPYAGSSAPTDWLLCDGSAISRTTYSSLFALLGTTFGAGDGSTTFNIPDMRGRSPVGVGTGTQTESGVDADVDTAADTLTVPSNSTKWVTGMSVQFTLASGTITGLTSGNTYYVIRASATTIKLASSLVNAQNGTAINLTAKSSPVWTITHTYTARTLAERGGEEAHAMSSTELLAHTHTTTAGSSGSSGLNRQAAASDNNSTSSSTGGNAAMNIMQPFLALNYIIKT
jgi:microcystin-dependent protein